MSEYALFVVAPYLAAASLVAGALSALLDRSQRAELDAQAATARWLAGRHRVLALGLAGVLLGHALILAWPHHLARWAQPLERLFVVEASLFLLGVAAFAGLMVAIARQVPRGRRQVSVVDVTFVGVLLVVVVSGLAIPVLYRWAAAWSSVTLAPYVRSVASLQPELAYLESMPYLVKLHVFSSSVVIALVPFTTPARGYLSAAGRAVDRALTPVNTTFGRTCRLLQDRARQRAANLMWSEDEAD